MTITGIGDVAITSSIATPRYNRLAQPRIITCYSLRLSLTLWTGAVICESPTSAPSSSIVRMTGNSKDCNREKD